MAYQLIKLLDDRINILKIKPLYLNHDDNIINIHNLYFNNNTFILNYIIINITKGKRIYISRKQHYILNHNNYSARHIINEDYFITNSLKPNNDICNILKIPYYLFSEILEYDNSYNMIIDISKFNIFFSSIL